MGNLASSDGNLATPGGNLATDANAPTDGSLTTARLGLLDIDGNLDSGQTLHEVIRTTVLALGRGAGAAAFRVDFFVRWGCDGGQGCDGGHGCTNSGDNGCNGQSASLYLNEVELGFSAGSAIGWLGAMSKTMLAKVRPEWRRAGFTSAIGCPGRHLGACGQPRPIGLVFDIGSVRLSSTSRCARGPSAVTPCSEIAWSSKWRERSQLMRSQLVGRSQLTRSQLARAYLPSMSPAPLPLALPPLPRSVAGVMARRVRGGAYQTQRWVGQIGLLWASVRKNEVSASA